MNMLDGLELAKRFSELPGDNSYDSEQLVFYAFKVFVKKLYEEGFEIRPVVQGEDAAYLMKRWIGKDTE